MYRCSDWEVFTPSSEFLASLTTLEVVVMWGPLTPQACDRMTPK